MIKRMLALSTVHLPTLEPDFGVALMCEHAFGWIVFVSPDIVGAAIPEWFRAIHEHAVANGATLVNFDADGEIYPTFRQYVWGHADADPTLVIRHNDTCPHNTDHSVGPDHTLYRDGRCWCGSGGETHRQANARALRGTR